MGDTKKSCSSVRVFLFSVSSIVSLTSARHWKNRAWSTSNGREVL